MLEIGKSNSENIGTMSSIFFLTYAVGQLVNGILGDKIKARYLEFISYGAAAISNLAFSNAVSSIGWKNLILVWMSFMACGVIVAIYQNSKKV